MDKIQNVGWFIAGVVCAVVALYLGFQCLFGEAWSIWMWMWKLPVGIVSTMAAIIFCDVGINGDQPPR